MQTINVGSAPNDGTGDALRTAFQKVNSNFAEVAKRGGPGAPTSTEVGPDIYVQDEITGGGTPGLWLKKAGSTVWKEVISAS
jgi:hypothetical protein